MSNRDTIFNMSEATPNYTPYPLPNGRSPGLLNVNHPDFAESVVDTVKSISNRPLSRRALLGGMAALVAVEAVGKTEAVIEDYHWPSVGTTIVMPGQADIAQPVKNAALSSSGFNGSHGLIILESLVHADVYAHNFPNGYYDFGTDFSASSIGDCTRSFADRLKPKQLDLHTVSEGALIALGGALKARRHLRVVTANDSPFDIDDVRDGAAVKVMAFARDHGLYDGDMIGSASAFAYHDMKLGGSGHGFKHIEAGIKSMWQAKKPSFLAAQAAYIAEANMQKKQAMYSDIIDDNSHFIFFKTQYSATDSVVNDYQAAGKWLPWFSQLGAKTTLIEVPIEGHAHITSSINHGARTLRALLR